MKEGFGFEEGKENVFLSKCIGSRSFHTTFKLHLPHTILFFLVVSSFVRFHPKKAEDKAVGIGLEGSVVMVSLVSN